MTFARLRAELSELKVLALSRRRADIYVPNSDLPAWLQARQSAWTSEMMQQDSPYEWMLANLASAPKYPLKPEFARLAGDEAGCRDLFELVRG